MRPIFFDVDGVLIKGYHADPAYRQPWDKNIESDLGISKEALVDHFFTGPFSNEVLIGKSDLFEVLEKTLPLAGYEGDVESFVDYWFSNDSNVDHDLLLAIQELRDQGHKLYIATNQEHYRASFLWEVLGFKNYFDDIFYSARLGVRKSSSEFFDQVRTMINLDKDVTPLFFDDTPAVIESATQAQWEAIEYKTIADFHSHRYINDVLSNKMSTNDRQFEA